MGQTGVGRMKKEILRINDLNYTYTSTNRLENISLCILEGECVGFLGLTYSGKDLLVQLLDGNLEGGIDGAAVYIAGEKGHFTGDGIYAFCPAGTGFSGLCHSGKK